MSSKAGSRWIGKSGTPWSEADEARLVELWRLGRTVNYMSQVLDRSGKSIRDRMDQLGLSNDLNEIHEQVTSYLAARPYLKPPKGARYQDVNGDWWWWVARKNCYHNESERVRHMLDATAKPRRNTMTLPPRDPLSPTYPDEEASA